MEWAGRPPEESPTERFRADALWAVCQSICAGKAIDASLVSSRQEIGELLRKLAAGKDLARLRLMTGWRRDAVGDLLMRHAKGEVGVHIHWKDGTIKTTAQ